MWCTAVQYISRNLPEGMKESRKNSGYKISPFKPEIRKKLIHRGH